MTETTRTKLRERLERMKVGLANNRLGRKEVLDEIDLKQAQLNKLEDSLLKLSVQEKAYVDELLRIKNLLR